MSDQPKALKVRTLGFNTQLWLLEMAARLLNDTFGEHVRYFVITPLDSYRMPLHRGVAVPAEDSVVVVLTKEKSDEEDRSSGGSVREDGGGVSE